MINSYSEFLLEGKLCKLILEGDMKASEDFLQRLKKIKAKSKLANVLYKAFKEELYITKSLTQNYIDVSDEDTISFLSDTKADKIEDFDTESPYAAKGRGTIKIGRFVRALLNNDDFKEYCDEFLEDGEDELSFKDKDIEIFVNLYKATKIDVKNKFKIVKGEDIRKWYDEDKYEGTGGTLGSSCMRYDSCQEYFDIYTENKQCNMLIYINEDGELLGRALIWKLSESPCNAKYFMDRVYVNKDSDINKFVTYAEENNFLYKYRMGFDTDESYLFYYNNKPVFGKIEVKLEKSKFDNYPFLDTLYYLNIKDKTLSNVGSKGAITLGDTSGESNTCGYCGGTGVVGNKKTECIDCIGNIEKIRNNIKQGYSYPVFKNVV